MENQEDSDESPEAFLAGLGTRLSEKDGEDAELAAILKAHILKVSPAREAVGQAMAAINLLASQRASPPKEGGTDG